jgi:hypothetical protein
MKSYSFLASALLLSSLPCVFAVAQLPEKGPISTDRPSIGAETDLVPVGSLQIESGVTWSRDSSSSTFDGPESLLRFGLSKSYELQLTTPNMRHSAGLPIVSMGDLTLGSKIRLGQATWSWPLAAVVAVSLPIGSREMTSGGVDPSLLLASSHNFPHSLLFSTSAVAGWVSIPGAKRAWVSQSATSLARSVGRRGNVFLEAAPFVSSAPGGSGFSGDGGMTWSVSKLVQLDWRAGATVQNGSSTAFASVGYSIRRDR